MIINEIAVNLLNNLAMEYLPDQFTQRVTQILLKSRNVVLKYRAISPCAIVTNKISLYTGDRMLQISQT